MGVQKENKMPESRRLLSTSHRATVSENVENKQTKNRECRLILNQSPPVGLISGELFLQPMWGHVQVGAHNRPYSRSWPYNKNKKQKKNCHFEFAKAATQSETLNTGSTHHICRASPVGKNSMGVA